VIVLTGRKGSGKTETAKFLIYLYHRVFPEHRVIIFSSIPGLYDEFKFAIRVDLKKVEEEENENYKTDMSGVPYTSEFANSLVVFVDTEKYPNSKVERILYTIMNILAQNGKNHNICMITILHHLNKGLQSSTILREMDS
jgi:ABC-type oligopeptide transport system ATPase subunit